MRTNLNLNLNIIWRKTRAIDFFLRFSLSPPCKQLLMLNVILIYVMSKSSPNMNNLIDLEYLLNVNSKFLCFNFKI